MEQAQAGLPETAMARDPVCGMKVDPAKARFKTSHAGQEYFFCCAACLTKFQANPEGVLAAPPKPMGPGLVSIGIAGAPKPVAQVVAMRAPARPASGAEAAAKPRFARVCLSHVRRSSPDRPGPVPKMWHGSGTRVARARLDQDRIHVSHASRDRARRAGELPNLRHGSRAAHGDGGRRKS